MSKYRVEITKDANRQIAKLQKREKRVVLDLIASLSENPRPHGYKKLAGMPTKNTIGSTPETIE